MITGISELHKEIRIVMNHDIVEYMKTLIRIDTYIETIKRVQNRMINEYQPKFKKLEAQYSVCPKPPVKEWVEEQSLNRAWTPWGRSKIKKENHAKEAMAQSYYDAELKEYNAKLQDYNKRKASGSMLPPTILAQKNKYIEMLQYMDAKMNEALVIQSRMKSYGFINRAYIDDVQAICFFVDCFQKELVYELAGPMGAYSRWEEQKNRIAIHAKLDRMTGMLERIGNNQETLLQSVNTMVAQTDIVVEQMHAIISKQQLTGKMLEGIWIDSFWNEIQTSVAKYDK